MVNPEGGGGVVLNAISSSWFLYIVFGGAVGGL